jgi:hypothetical protein
MYGGYLLSELNEIFGMVSSGSPWSKIVDEIDDVSDGLKFRANKGEDVQDEYNAVMAFEEALLDAYNETGGAPLKRAIPPGQDYVAKTFNTDLSEWKYLEAFHKAVDMDPERWSEVGRVFSSVTVEITDDIDGAGRMGRYANTGAMAIQLKPNRSDVMQDTLWHELVHFCQYMMNAAIYGDATQDKWTFGMPPKKMRDIGVRQREGGEHVIDDAEFHANLSKSVRVVKRMVEDMDYYGRRAFLKSMLFGDPPSPSFSIDAMNFLEWTRKSMGLEILREKNPNKWKRAADVLTKAIMGDSKEE